MISISPREYQQSIFETAKNNNTLVVLPTGLGKTLIALLLAVERVKKHPCSKVLFLAPTRPLVEQHYNTFKSLLPELFADLQLFTGEVSASKRKEIFQTAEIIFSTPQCISNDLKKYLYKLDDTSLLIFDEAHRCLKNYAYTEVVRYYKQQSPIEFQRILGLTASPGSELDKVKQICNHLNIEKIESRTRDSLDVKKYLQPLEFEKVIVEFPQKFIEIRTLLKNIYNENISKLKERNLLFGPANKISLLKLQANLAKRISKRDFIAMSAISLTASSIKLSHALELLETQTLSGFHAYLQNLQTQADNNQSRAVKTLVNRPEFKASLISLKNLLKDKIEHPKINKIQEIASKEFQNNPKSKIIIFTQYRETASSISARLNLIPNIKAKVFVGQAKKLDSGLSQKEQKAIIQDFREGSVNVLCATSIGEEGLDIPEVSAVIFYEPIPSAIRKIQRAGRTARLKPGKLILLITKDTRDEINHYASTAREKKMYKTLDTVKQQIKNKSKTLEDFK